MSVPKPPRPDDATPSGDELWQILHDPSRTTELEQPAQPAGAKPAAPAAAQPAAPPAPVAVEEPDSSRIQRMISAPELLGEDFEYRPPATAATSTDDFDHALKNYYRETGISIKCRRHPEEEAVQLCPECQAYYCQACMVVRRGKLLCRDCATALFVPTEEQVLTSVTMGEDLPAEVAPEEHPEFQIGGTLFGLEGQPASPVKQLVALALDLLFTRLFVMAILFVAWLFTGHSQLPLYQIFAGENHPEVFRRVLDAAFVLRPLMPWLVIFAAVDYLYFVLALAVTNRTLGMSWTGCRVVTEWGDFVSLSAVMLRTLVFMVCLGWPAVIIGWWFPGFRGPHDYAGGTLVINYAGVKRIDVYETVQIKL